MRPIGSDGARTLDSPSHARLRVPDPAPLGRRPLPPSLFRGAVRDRVARARAQNGSGDQAGLCGLRCRRPPRLQVLLRQGEPVGWRELPRARPRKGARDPLGSEGEDRPPDPDGRPRARAVRDRRRGRRRPPDPGVPLPADGPHRGRGGDEEGSQREEGPVPRSGRLHADRRQVPGDGKHERDA